MIHSARHNNFDLIRLLAAAQVVFAHAVGHTDLVNRIPTWGKQAFDILMMLPGVPVFFVISGFLIAKSFEKNPADLKGYFWRRGLRIYPALWVCLALTLCVLAIFGFLPPSHITSPGFFAWLAGQLSFLQFYNPEAFRGFGIGVANGALWTITVELQFYLFVPLFCCLASRKALMKILTPALFILSFASYCVMDHQVNGPGGFTGAPIAFKLLHVTLVPHLWMFMLGILIHWNFDTLKSGIEGKFAWYLGAYIILMALLHGWVEARSITYYLAYLPSRTLLALATIAAAFSARQLSNRLLGGTDLSYGIYIYHSIIINVLVELGMMTSMTSVAWVYLISILLASLSWHVIEKPALACKNILPSSIGRRLRPRA